MTNRERINRALEIARPALETYVTTELKAKFAQRWQEAVLASGIRPSPKGELNLDTQALLKIMRDAWHEVFGKQLANAERNYVHELLDVRNHWAHEKPFSSDDTVRALDTAERLLKAIAAGEAAGEIARMRDELQRTVYTEQARNKTRYQTSVVGQPEEGLRPWRDIITPHKDVASGQYAQAEFAADLARVSRGEGGPEYVDPVEFYRRTFVTEGLRELLADAVLRLTGNGGDPVVELQTNFGGGKTHSMLALFHLFGGAPASALPGVETVLTKANVAKVPVAKRAVIVGSDLSPAQVHTKADGTKVHTMWGELAWQLGGKAGYQLVAASDAKGISPGAEVLTRLLSAHTPALVLIDEWVAYARQTVGKTDIPAGNFDAQVTFAQALTEAAKAVPGALIVASIPQSKLEVGGDQGQHALDALKHVFSRVAKQWRPATADEGFEIVRRRLFEAITDPELLKHRDAVVMRFRAMYRANAADFPNEVDSLVYENKMRSAYPIHPELFDRLYEEWSTLDKFQRTRGVLRLLARVISRLWEAGDRSLLIMPSSIPLDDSGVRSEITRYLADQWEPIIMADVDGQDSWPAQLDRDNNNFGKLSAARRVTRALYMGTAPGSGDKSPGIDDRAVKLACAQPGEPPAVFGDALRKVSDRARYIHQDQARYWIGTRANLNRMAEDAATDLLRDIESVWNEIRERLRKEAKKRSEWHAVHACPLDASDIPDDNRTRLVILDPTFPHTKTRSGSEIAGDAYKFAADALVRRAGGPRIYQNCLVFLAPDKKEMEGLASAAAAYLAWQKILDNQEALNLDKANIKQASNKVKEHNETINARIESAWHHALAPTQTTSGATVTWDESLVRGAGPCAERAWAKLSRDAVFAALGAPNLRSALDQHLWTNRPHVSFGELADWFAKYLYLPRVLDSEVLVRTVESGTASTDLASGFATASEYDEAQRRYRGLVLRRSPDAIIKTTLIVKPSAAEAQETIEHETRGRSVPASTPPPATGPAIGSGADRATVPARRPTRYIGTARLDPMRAGSQVGRIAEELITHFLGSPGGDVEVRLEIRVRSPGGIDERIQRTVSENSSVLKFETSRFDTD